MSALVADNKMSDEDVVNAEQLVHVDADISATQSSANSGDNQEFVTYNALTQYMHTIAKSQNFGTRISGTGMSDAPGHFVTFKCWCHQRPHNTNQQPAIETFQRKRKRRAPRVNVNGKAAVGCNWFMSFYMNLMMSNHAYKLTKANLLHNGHNIKYAVSVSTAAS
jgi:hypothetical protein